MRKMQRVLFIFLTIFMVGCQQQTATKSNSSAKEQASMTEKKTTQTPGETTMSTNESTSAVTKEFSAGSLLKATSENDLTTVQNILQNPNYRIDETNERGETSLLIATHENYIEIAKALINAGADINLQDQISDSPYLYASAQGKTEILKYMLTKAVPDQQKVNRFGGNGLIPAAEKGHLDNVKLLLQDGRVNINHQNNYGYTALIEAVALKDGSALYQEIIKVLLEAGADKNLRDNTSRNAKDYAQSLAFTEMEHILDAY
jgi:ankyrin repeat protein